VYFSLVSNIINFFKKKKKDKERKKKSEHSLISINLGEVFDRGRALLYYLSH
jgi:hypothetical protein